MIFACGGWSIVTNCVFGESSIQSQRSPTRDPKQRSQTKDPRPKIVNRSSAEKWRRTQTKISKQRSQTKAHKPKMPNQRSRTTGLKANIISNRRFRTKEISDSKPKVSKHRSQTKDPIPKSPNHNKKRSRVEKKHKRKSPIQRSQPKIPNHRSKVKDPKQILVNVTLWSCLCWPSESSQNRSGALWRVHDVSNMDRDIVSVNLEE